MDTSELVAPFSAQLYKIEAIKRLRRYCEVTYGAAPGLKEAKEFIESLAAESHYKTVVRTELDQCKTEDMVRILKDRGYVVWSQDQSGKRYL